MAGLSCIPLMVTFLLGMASADLVGSLLPLDDTIEVGSDFVMNCTLDASSNDGRTAEDVIWKHNWATLSPDMYTGLSDTVSQLTLTNVTFSDSGTYVCLFAGDNYIQALRARGSELSVGRKPQPPTLNCVIPSPDAYRCSWKEGILTNIQTQHRFMFKHGGSWVNCPFSGHSSCHLPMEWIIDLNQHVRVTSTNHLGSATTEKVFNIYTDVVVNQPRNVQVGKLDSETSLGVLWSVPAEWLPRSEDSLMYKLRYEKDECDEMANHSCCCWVETQHVTSKSFTLRDLEPYTLYGVQVSARFDGAQEENWSEWSDIVAGITRETKPRETVEDLHINQTPNIADPINKRNILMLWTSLPLEGQNGRRLGYQVAIQSPDVTEFQQEHNTTQNHFTIHDLEKFRGYLVKVAAYNSAGIGPWSSISVDSEGLTKAPSTPDEVRAVALTTTSIFVEWEEPSHANSYTNFTVTWGQHNGQIKSYTTPNVQQLSYVINDLASFALYDVGVKTLNSLGESDVKWVKGGVRTLEGVPDASPARVEVEPVKNHPDRLLLSWQRPPPRNINGILLGYVISCCQRRLDVEKANACLDGPVQWDLAQPYAVSKILADLVPSTSYLIWIAAYTVVGVGPDSKPVEGITADASHSIPLLAIVIPIAILLGVCIFGLFVWHFRHLSVELPGEQWNKESGESSENLQTVHDEVVSSSEIAVISGTSVEHDGCEVSTAKTTMLLSNGLELILDGVQLDPKMTTYDRSESGDSGILSSPDSDHLGFSTVAVKGFTIAEQCAGSAFSEVI